MTKPDKLSIEQVEAYFKHLGALGGFDRLEAMNITSQLADTMRENERLRKLLSPCGHNILDNIAISGNVESWICRDCLAVEQRNKDSDNG